MPTPSSPITVLQQALRQIIMGSAGANEHPLSTLSHGFVDVNGNIVLLVNEDGILVDATGAEVLIEGAPIQIINVVGLQTILDSTSAHLSAHDSEITSLTTDVVSTLPNQINFVSDRVSNLESASSTYGNVVTKNIGTTGGTVPDGADSRFTQIFNIASFPVSPIQLAFNHTLITATLVDNLTKSIEIDNGANGDIVSFSFLGAGSIGGSVTITDGGSFSTTVSSLRSGDYAFISLTRNNGSWHKNYLAINGAPVSAQSFWFVPLNCYGEMAVNVIFGRYQPSASVQILGAELDAQDAPTGSSLTVTLVDGSGVSLFKTVTLSDGVGGARALFSPPLTVSADSVVSGKVTSVGSTTPGSWLTLRLICQSA